MFQKVDDDGGKQVEAWHAETLALGSAVADLAPLTEGDGAVVHTAAYWLLHTLKGLAFKTSFWRDAQFDTICLAFVKIAARVTELVTRIKVSLPSSYPYKQSLARFASRALALPP